MPYDTPGYDTPGMPHTILARLKEVIRYARQACDLPGVVGIVLDDETFTEALLALYQETNQPPPEVIAVLPRSIILDIGGASLTLTHQGSKA